MTGKGCVKCGSKDAATKEVAMTGTGLSKMFDIQHNQFVVVYCKKCGYSINPTNNPLNCQIFSIYFLVKNYTIFHLGGDMQEKTHNDWNQNAFFLCSFK